MIPLQKPAKSECLSRLDVASLTQEFKNSGAAVWAIDELKQELLATSHQKCAYCECGLGEESKYMEVEHFKPKQLYPDDVLSWANLLPACKRCNGAKSEHDVLADPIVNPYENSPAEHLSMQDYRISSKTSIGSSSIAVLRLNDGERLVLPRFRVGSQVHESLADCRERMDAYLEGPTVRRRNKVRGMLEALLRECQPTSTYSATAATALLSDKAYQSVRSDLEKLSLWTADLATLHDGAQLVALLDDE